MGVGPFQQQQHSPIGTPQLHVFGWSQTHWLTSALPHLVHGRNVLGACHGSAVAPLGCLQPPHFIGYLHARYCSDLPEMPRVCFHPDTCARLSFP